MLRRYLCSSLVLLLVACQDGQSGSENIPTGPTVPEPIPPGEPGARAHCPCWAGQGYQRIRARVLGRQAFPEVGTARYELEVEEILSPAPFAPDVLNAGDHFGGYWTGQLFCGGESDAISEGDSVLAFYRRGDQDDSVCCEYVDCTNECATVADPEEHPEQHLACENRCVSDTATACSAHADEARLRGTLELLPWQDEFVFGRSATATATLELDQIALIGTDACEQELPDSYEVLETPDNGDQPANGAPPPNDGSEVPPDSATPPPPATPPTTPATPAPTATSTPTPAATPTPSAPSQPAAPPGTAAPVGNPTSPATPPPAHPEEYRVRCAMPNAD